MIIVTGAAGFIASSLVSKLNQERFKDIVLVDDFSNEKKNKNIENKIFSQKVDREFFFEWIEENHRFVQFVFHLGARTDTTEFDVKVFEKLNLNYSKQIWQVCVEYGLPLVYASSAATYGMGEWGYDDSHEVVEQLKPLNPYGESKNDFDKWALAQDRKPYFWAGMKFFNVFGPNEYHKGRMASVVFHAYHQIKQNKYMNLFRSHRSDYKDGEQIRDFIYVKDVVEILFYFLKNRTHSGIYNLGTGKARSFLDLTRAVFNAMQIPENIDFIDTPEDIREKYQYFTQANMQKLKSIGCHCAFTNLEDAVSDYVTNYLEKQKYY
jgi:ADP-L-glycero-D-manno-heptose 6-epimerase